MLHFSPDSASPPDTFSPPLDFFEIMPFSSPGYSFPWIGLCRARCMPPPLSCSRALLFFVRPPIRAFFCHVILSGSSFFPAVIPSVGLVFCFFELGGTFFPTCIARGRRRLISLCLFFRCTIFRPRFLIVPSFGCLRAFFWSFPGNETLGAGKFSTRNPLTFLEFFPCLSTRALRCAPFTV